MLCLEAHDAVQSETQASAWYTEQQVHEQKTTRHDVNSSMHNASAATLLQLPAKQISFSNQVTKRSAHHC